MLTLTCAPNSQPFTEQAGQHRRNDPDQNEGPMLGTVAVAVVAHRKQA